MQTVRVLFDSVRRARTPRLVAAALVTGVVVTAQPAATFHTWQVGDVLAGVGDPFKYLWTQDPGVDAATTGLVLRYASAPDPVQRLTEPDNWFTTGCAYYPDPVRPELWTSSFTSTVNRFDPVTSAWSPWVDTSPVTDGAVESLAFAPDGSVFIATPWSQAGAQLHHYTHGEAASSTRPAHLKSYAHLPGGAVDWLDVGRDPNGDLVVYYTAESEVEQFRADADYYDRLDGGEASGLYRINITATDAAQALDPASPVVAEKLATVPDRKVWALRLLPNRQGILVAGSNAVHWLGLDGQPRRAPFVLGGTDFFALNISPDGQSFWTATGPAGDSDGRTPVTGHIYKVNIATGAIERTIDTGYPSVGGLCVVREYTAAFDQCTNEAGVAIACPMLPTDSCGDGTDNDNNGLIDEGCTATLKEEAGYGGFSYNARPAGSGDTFDVGSLPAFMYLQTGAGQPTVLQMWGQPGYADARPQPYAVPVTVHHADGSSFTGTYYLAVKNTYRPPVFTAVTAGTVTTAVTQGRASISVPAGPSVAAAVAASDPDSSDPAYPDALTYSIGSTGGLPLAIDPRTGQFIATARLFARAQPYAVQVLVTDRGGLVDRLTLDVTVTGVNPNQAPVCSGAAPSISTIAPPDHRLVPVTITGVVDPDATPVSIAIASIFQDEPTHAEGDGSTSTDGAGVGTSTAWVRAERTGQGRAPGDGRVYHIAFTASDALGASCSGEVRVGVPHDQGGRAAPVDGGALYNSLVATPALSSKPGR